MTDRTFGYILVDKQMHIEEARSQASYEDTLDAQLKAVLRGWVYVPLGLGELIDELSRAEIYE